MATHPSRQGHGQWVEIVLNGAPANAGGTFTDAAKERVHVVASTWHVDKPVHQPCLEKVDHWHIVTTPFEPYPSTSVMATRPMQREVLAANTARTRTRSHHLERCALRRLPSRTVHIMCVSSRTPCANHRSCHHAGLWSRRQRGCEAEPQQPPSDKGTPPYRERNAHHIQL